MAIGLTTCGCCGSSTGCTGDAAEHMSREGTTRVVTGLETSLWERDIITTVDGPLTQHTYPMRFGEESQIYNTNTPEFIFPPAEFRHFTGSEVTLSISGVAFQFAGRKRPVDDWDTTGVGSVQPFGWPVWIGGVPLPAVTATTTQVMKRDDGESVWVPLQDPQANGTFVKYYRGPGSIPSTGPGTPPAEGTVITGAATVPVSSIRGAAIACDISFRFEAFNARLLQANIDNDPIFGGPNDPTFTDYRRWLQLMQWDRFGVQNFQVFSGAGINISGLEYCPQLDRSKHTWKIVANGIPSNRWINWHGGLQPNHTFGPLEDCSHAEERTSFGLILESWTVYWGKPMPEIKHVSIYKNIDGVNKFSSQYYRPTEWDGVSEETFYAHSGIAVKGPDPFNQSFLPFSYTDYVPEYFRNEINFARIYHPDSFTLSRVAL